jgi:hypothetical protein
MKVAPARDKGTFWGGDTVPAGLGGVEQLVSYGQGCLS